MQWIFIPGFISSINSDFLIVLKNNLFWNNFRWPKKCQNNTMSCCSPFNKMPQLLTLYLTCSSVHSSLCVSVSISLSLNLLRAGCPITPKYSRVPFSKTSSLSCITNIQPSKSGINIGITLPSDVYPSIQFSQAGQHCHFAPFWLIIFSKIMCCV